MARYPCIRHGLTPARLVDEFFEKPNIVAGHALNGEPLFEIGPHLGPIHAKHIVDGGNGFVHAVDNPAANSVLMTSRTEPLRQATTGVPHDMASIMTSPKGSGQSIGNSKAPAFPSNSAFCCSFTSPMKLICSCCSTSGRISLSQ